VSVGPTADAAAGLVWWATASDFPDSGSVRVWLGGLEVGRAIVAVAPKTVARRRTVVGLMED